MGRFVRVGDMDDDGLRVGQVAVRYNHLNRVAVVVIASPGFSKSGALTNARAPVEWSMLNFAASGEPLPVTIE